MKVFHQDGSLAGYVHEIDLELWGHLPVGEVDYMRIYRIPTNDVWILYEHDVKKKSGHGTLCTEGQARAILDYAKVDLTNRPRPPLNIATWKKDSQKVEGLYSTEPRCWIIWKERKERVGLEAYAFLRLMEGLHKTQPTKKTIVKQMLTTEDKLKSVIKRLNARLRKVKIPLRFGCAKKLVYTKVLGKK